MTKRLVTLTLALLLAVTTFAGCSNNVAAPDSSSDAKAEKEIVIANVSAVKSLDPHAVNEVVTSRPTRHIFSKLVKLNSNLEIVPDIAASWEFVTETELVFKLREDVVWHDGTPLDANQVKWSFERQRTIAAAKYLVDPISNIEVVDDYTIKFTLAEPYAPIMANFAHVCSAIVPQHYIEKVGDEEFANNPIGTGSMKFVEQVSGERVVIERFDDFYGEKALAPRIVFKTMPEDSARSIALENGEIDFDAELATQDVERVKENEELTLYEWPTIFVEYVLMNTSKPPFDDVRVRQAVAHAVDRTSIVDVVMEGHARESDTVLPIGVLGHTEDYAKYPRDIEAAKKLLADAGYPDGLSTTIVASGNLREREAQMLQANLAEIGITAEISLYENTALLDMYANGDYEISVTSWGNGTADPEGTLFVTFYSGQKGAAGNRSFYDNPEVDEALMQGRTVTDPEERAKYYTLATQLIMKDVPWVPLYNKHFLVGTRADLKGVDMHPTGYDAYDMLHYE